LALRVEYTTTGALFDPKIVGEKVKSQRRGSPPHRRVGFMVPGDLGNTLEAPHEDRVYWHHGRVFNPGENLGAYEHVIPWSRELNKTR